MYSRNSSVGYKYAKSFLQMMLLLLFFHILFCLCGGIHATIHVWRSEDNVLFFHLAEVVPIVPDAGPCYICVILHILLYFMLDNPPLLTFYQRIELRLSGLLQQQFLSSGHFPCCLFGLYACFVLPFHPDAKT